MSDTGIGMSAGQIARLLRNPLEPDAAEPEAENAADTAAAVSRRRGGALPGKTGNKSRAKAAGSGGGCGRRAGALERLIM